MIDVIKIAKSVINSAIVGLNDLSNDLDDNYIKLIELISNLKGRVIVSGMGKSGHIARKIAATLASTGTAAYFVHPGEASHGDLGMITQNDAVVLLSSSGETTELKDIVNYTKRYSIPLIAIVRNNKSSLAETANIVISIPPTAEALEFDAPTTSTTMMLVFGDALAMTLLEKKGFSREDFQIFHPGGRLGASFIKVKDLMHINDELPIININQSMMEAIEEMSKKGFGCVAVLDNSNDLVGIITDGNLRRKLCPTLFNMKADFAMTTNPITIKESSLVLEALNIMNKKAITSLLVTNNKKLVGLIHMHDCLKSGTNIN